MKTLKLIVSIVFMTVFMNTGKLFAGDPSWENDKYQKDNGLIKEDIAAVNFHKGQVQQLKAKLKNENTANNHEAVIMTKRDLAKEKADLRKSKAYLCADKKDLKRDYKLSMRNYREVISKDEANLKKQKAKLNEAITKGNEDAIMTAANKVAYYSNRLKNDQALLTRERTNMNSNFAAIDKQLDKNTIQPAGLKQNETAYTENGKRH